MESQKKVILVVDDIEQNVTVISQILRSNGYQVLAAFSGEQALKMLEKRTPDLILLDVMLPDINGFEVCKRIKQNKSISDIPIIFLSALSEAETKGWKLVVWIILPNRFKNQRYWQGLRFISEFVIWRLNGKSISRN